MDIKINCEKNQLQLDKLLIVRQRVDRVQARQSTNSSDHPAIAAIYSEIGKTCNENPTGRSTVRAAELYGKTSESLVAKLHVEQCRAFECKI